MTIHNPRDLQAAEIAAAAARLTGTPEQLAARLRTLLDDGPPQASPRETSDQRADRLEDAKRHDLEVAAIRQRLASDFAEAHGLQPTTAPMSRKELARRAPPGGKWHRTAKEFPGAFRHPTFYRGADRRAAAMAIHALPEETDLGAIEAWAAGYDLVASCPDFPSWERPGAAFLAVLEPISVASAEAQGSAEQPAPVSVEADTLPAPVELDTPEIVDAEPAPSTAPDLPSMRPVAPIDLAGIAPRDLASEEDPDFDVVDPSELLIDEQYQRGLSPKSLTLIRSIVENWSWARFKVPTCVRVDGRLHVIDGQHSVIAAATHPGIQAVPVLIAKVPAVADRAAAFVSHARSRLAATALQVQRAALVAGDDEAVTLDAVCRRAGVDLLPFAPSDSRYLPRQTVAVVGLRRLIAKQGAERAGEILGALAAADLAPISGDHVRLGELLLCDPAYADSFDAERLTAAMRGLTAKLQAEARELAIAQRLSAWRALAAVLARNSRAGASRRRASA